MDKKEGAVYPLLPAEISVALGGLAVGGKENLMPNQLSSEEPMIELSERVMIFNSGIGPIEPTSEVSGRDLAETVERMQVPVADSHIVCIDERVSAEGKQPARRKTAGGPTLTGYAAALLAGKDLSYEEVVSRQAEAGVSLGGHTDNHSAENDPACGAAKKLADAIKAVGEHAHDQEWLELGEAILSEAFNKDIWMTKMAEAQKVTRLGLLSGWQHGRMISVLKEHGGVIEVLDGTHDALKDPENLRHNHWGEGINANFRAGYTNDRDNSPVPFFQVDVEAVVESVKPFASSDEEMSELLHGAVLYNLGVAYVLTKNQRITTTA